MRIEVFLLNLHHSTTAVRTRTITQSPKLLVLVSLLTFADRSFAQIAFNSSLFGVSHVVKNLFAPIIYQAAKIKVELPDGRILMTNDKSRCMKRKELSVGAAVPCFKIAFFSPFSCPSSSFGAQQGLITRGTGTTADTNVVYTINAPPGDFNRHFGAFSSRG